MFDHVSIRVRDRAVAEDFYTAVLDPLGVDATYSTRSFAVWEELQVAAAAPDHPLTQGLHLACVAPSREQVDAFWAAGVARGAPDDGPPGERPRYGPGYYGAYLRDPDGNSVEATHHPRRRRTGLLDHLWLRVADLAAATAFYATIAPAAGLHVHRADAERTTLAVADEGGSLTLVPGPPTANVHIAFPGDDDAVRRFHADALAAGHRSNGGPGERPRYHRGYYAAYVLDPDGNNIEVVNHHRAP